MKDLTNRFVVYQYWQEEIYNEKVAPFIGNLNSLHRYCNTCISGGRIAVSEYRF